MSRELLIETEGDEVRAAVIEEGDLAVMVFKNLVDLKDCYQFVMDITISTNFTLLKFIC